MTLAELMVGSWSVTLGTVRSRLDLRADGSFRDSVVPGNTAMWGRWSVRAVGPGSVVRLELDGATPMFADGPNGTRVQVDWTPVVTWVVRGATADRIVLAQGVMDRVGADGATSAPARPAAAAGAPAAATPDPVAAIYAKIAADDRATTDAIAAAEAVQTKAEGDAAQAKRAAWSDIVHAGAASFTKNL